MSSGGQPADDRVDAYLRACADDRFSGSVVGAHGPWSAVVQFADGVVVDARLGPFVNEPALVRLLLLGALPLTRDVTPRAPSAGTLASVDVVLSRFAGAYALWVELAQYVGGFAQVWALRFDVLASRLGEFPDAINPLLRLLDGTRTVREVVAMAPLDEVLTLRILARLLQSGVLQVPPRPIPLTTPSARNHIVDVEGGLQSALLGSLVSREGDPITLDNPRDVVPLHNVKHAHAVAAQATASDAPMSTSGGHSVYGAPPKAPSLVGDSDLDAWLGVEDSFFKKAPTATRSRSPALALSVLLACVIAALVAAVLARALG